MVNRFAVKADPAAAYPEAAGLKSALRLGDWAAARSILDGQTPAARTALMRTAEEMKRAGSVLERALADNPADATATALLGFHRIAAAWRVRTGAPIRQVSRRRLARFHAGLAEAENILTVGTSRHPDDLALWTSALATARGLELGQHTARERYARLDAIDPHHLPGQSAMVQQLAPKWGGTWADMHALSREAMRDAPWSATAHPRPPCSPASARTRPPIPGTTKVTRSPRSGRLAPRRTDGPAPR